MPDFAVGELPVTGVSWFEASAFAAWMGGGLPTQEEWANAARGRDAGRLFATASGEIDRSNACFGRPFGNTAPAPVSAYAPNPEGFFGLCGNSWDWCADRLGANRVIRGGGCMDAAAFCRVDSRYRNAPLDRDCCVGFRVKIAV
jgi:formylglycine-generating enzyme required for sulfatase activity